MAIYDFFLSRNGTNVTGGTYIGHRGRLFYDDANGSIRRSDGVTPGGLPIPITLATSTVAGGIKLGPGVTTNPEGQLIIDSEGLDFSFGDFASITGTYLEGHPKEGDEYALLQSIKQDEDIVLASNGDGGIKVIGEFRIYPANGSVNGSLTVQPRFRATADGQIRILIPDPDDLAGGVQIVGNSTGTQQDPVNQGILLHITGHDGIEARSYLDSIGAYAGFVGRRSNGTSASPTGVLANQEVSRYAANAYTSDQGYQATGIGQLRWYANENISSTNKGGRAEFWAVPNGTANAVKVVTIDGNSLTMASGKTIIGNLTGTATTATTATNLAAANTILTGTISVNPTSVAGGSSSVQTFTLTGATTNHKIVITSGTAFDSGLIITAAWISALNTISIEFRNTTNQAIDTTTKTIQYFAWV
jgi:hypothetical protein